jgi:putative transposase
VLKHLLIVQYYRRNLPHWIPEEKAIFLTWRLRGSLPRTFFDRLDAKKSLTDGKRFVLADQELDRARRGPLWLKDPRIADSVVRALLHGECALGFYALHAYVVMANHVHALLTPKIELQRLTNGLKGVTARIANQILRRPQKPFWQDESFDHWVRTSQEFARIGNYIEQNPVTAGLVAKPEDWRWSSAFQRGAGEWRRLLTANLSK